MEISLANQILLTAVIASGIVLSVQVRDLIKALPERRDQIVLACFASAGILCIVKVSYPALAIGLFISIAACSVLYIFLRSRDS